MIKNDIKGVLLAQGCVRYIDVLMYDQKRHKRVILAQGYVRYIDVLMYDQKRHKRGPFGSRMR